MSSRREPKAAADGLKERHRGAIIEILAAHPKVERIVLFGSRAWGNFRPQSDIDLALYGEELTWDDLTKLKEKLEETTIPYRIDLLLVRDLEDRGLREQIEKHGVEWFCRPSRKRDRSGKGTAR